MADRGIDHDIDVDIEIDNDGDYHAENLVTEAAIHGETPPFADGAIGLTSAELKRSFDRLQKLQTLAERIHADGDLDDLFRAMLAVVVQALDVDRAFIAAWDGRQLDPRACHEIDLSGKSFPLSQTILRKVLHEGQCVLTIDALTDPEFNSAKSVQEHRIRSVLCCPLGSTASPDGILYADNNCYGGAFNRQDLRYLHALAYCAYPLIRRAKAAASAPDVRTPVYRNVGAGHELVGVSKSLHDVFSLAQRVASSDLPVLLTGETGTGKEVIARAVHMESPRSQKPFVAVNMGTLSRETGVAELFGHVRGAYTGAELARSGLFMQAAGGTLFLDEIGSSPPEVQVMLLRVVQEGSVRPLGADMERQVDVRLIAACNTNLEQAVQLGHFREDLFHRLNVLPIEVPPLRARTEDIRPLFDHFLRKRAPGRRFSGDAEAALLAYAWPGNVRELQNVVERCALLASSDVIPVSELPRAVLRGAPAPAAPSDDVRGREMEPLRRVLERVERVHIKQALEESGGRRDIAIKLLGISRATFYGKLKQYGLG